MKLEFSVQNFTVGHWSVNSSGIFTELSEQACRILDMAPGTSLNLDDYLSYMPEEDREIYLRARRQAYQSGQMNLEYRLKINGKTKWVRDVSMLDTQSESDNAQLRTLIQDITEFSANHIPAVQQTQSDSDISVALLNFSEEERKKAAKALHSDISQRLAVVSIELASTNGLTSHTDKLQKINSIRSDLASVSDEIHKLSRQLYPSVVENLGLLDALQSEIDNFQRKEHIDITFASSIDSISLARFQIISATFMERRRRGSQLLKVVRSSRQRNKQYYHELSAVDRRQKIPDFCSFGTGSFGF